MAFVHVTTARLSEAVEKGSDPRVVGGLKAMQILEQVAPGLLADMNRSHPLQVNGPEEELLVLMQQAMLLVYAPAGGDQFTNWCVPSAISPPHPTPPPRRRRNAGLQACSRPLRHVPHHGCVPRGALSGRHGAGCLTRTTRVRRTRTSTGFCRCSNPAGRPTRTGRSRALSTHCSWAAFCSSSQTPA